jgi:NodT family efflux transporter outer membrane factor (OMF) lipoprotein
MRGFVVLVVAVALSGCDLGPGPVQPKISLPAKWGNAAAAIPGATAWPAPDWWRNFNSPELDSLIAEAQANNLDIAGAAARVQQADAQLRVTGATLWPTIGFGSQIRQRGPVVDQSIVNGQSSSSSTTLSSDLNNGSSTSDQRTSVAATFTAQYELDFWGRNHDNVRAARETLNANRFDRETVALTVTSGVASTYLQILTLKDRIAIATRNLTDAEEVERVTEAKARDGAVSRLDVAQQQSQVAAQEAAIAPLVLQEKQATDALALLLGRNPEGFAIAGTGLKGVALPIVPTGLPSGLITRRPDIAEAEANLAAANANLMAARAAMLPNIDLSSSLDIETIAAGLTFGGLGAAYSAGAALAQPIFDAGSLRAQRDVAAGKQLELVQAYRSSILNALSDVENALASIDSLKTQQQWQNAQIASAATALQLAQSQYRAGATELLTVVDAERTLFQAEDQTLGLDLSQFQSAIALYKALGGGWQSANDTKLAATAG